MKIYLVSICFFAMALNICQAQIAAKKSVPLLKESAEIDSLILSVVTQENFKGIQNDSCFLLGLNRTKNDAGFIKGIRALNHKKNIYNYMSFKNRKSLGYFEFNGYLIFVYDDEFMSKFFTQTGLKKEFTFIKPTVKDEIFMIQNFMSWTLFYSKGEFNYGTH